MDSDKSNQIKELLTRGVERIFPSLEFLESRLNSGEKLSLYYGIDPTGPTLHVGHVIELLKLKKFQELGHQVILLIGDFTAMVGDPTDKQAVRQPLTKEEIKKNYKLYKKQASKFLQFSGENSAKVVFNSKWLSKMKLDDVFSLASHMTHAQAIKRDMFQKRIADGKDLYLHEFLYPIMQGYDSVALEVDGELGGNDQTFNMLIGRDLLKKMKNKEKFVISMKLLVDSTGKKMGKTEGNIVSLNESPSEMFGKIMSWPDSLIINGFELCTEVPKSQIDAYRADLESGAKNPRDIKVALGKSIVKLLSSEKSALKAIRDFEKTFQKKEVPEDVPVITLTEQNNFLDMLIELGLISSKSDWRRLVEGKAVSVVGTNEAILDPSFVPQSTITLRLGKKRFVKVVR